ncbi:MAG: hypothetical protein M3X11_19050 [Acidobacteriota bacterium]|nr:hypothetical protein [Acidobacteriota bacterium]
MHINWEKLKSSGSPLAGEIWRAKVPGGWLLIIHYGETAITFYPDPQHKWDGSSLP